MNNNEQPPLQRLLAFDTSTSSLAVAVLENGVLRAEQNIHAERNHSAFLVKAIDDCLRQSGINKNELDGIAVGIGPGSYTGIRIAVTTAKTLAWALRLPVYGASSLAAIALGGWATGTKQDVAKLVDSAASGPVNRDSGADKGAGKYWIVPMVEARRGQAYTALFSAGDGRLPRRLEPDAIRLMTDWTEQLARRLDSLNPAERPSALWFVGEPTLHEAVIESLRLKNGPDVYAAPYNLEGVFIGLVGLDRSRLGTSDEVHALEPNYTQLAEAEAKQLRKA